MVDGDAHALVRSVLTHCRVDPPGDFEWFGRRTRVAETASGETRGIFLRALSLHLYFHVFCPGTPVARLPSPSTPGAGEIRALLTGHSLACPDRDRWDAGWIFVGPSADAYRVRRDGLDFLASADAVRPRQGETLHAGGDVEVLVPADRWSLSPGFMLIHGQRLLQPRSAGNRRTRLYLHMDMEGAREVIALCERFNQHQVPFTLKVAAHPDAFERCDTVILFVERQDYRRASAILVEAAHRSGHRPRPPNPAFASVLAPGVSVADDPPGEESFGASRVRLLAMGILRAWEAGRTSLDARLHEVGKAFREEGRSLERPHLEPGSTEYETEPWARWPHPSGSASG